MWLQAVLSLVASVTFVFLAVVYLVFVVWAFWPRRGGRVGSVGVPSLARGAPARRPYDQSDPDPDVLWPDWARDTLADLTRLPEAK